MSEQETETLDRPVAVDINELAASATEMEINPEGDAFRPPPPPADDYYEAKIVFNDPPFEKVPFRKDSKRKRDDDATHFLSANIVLEIADPDGESDGQKLFDSLNCLVQRGSNTNRVATLLRFLGETVEAKTTDVELMLKLKAALATDPTIGIKTQWEGYDKDEGERGKTVKRGMKRFPQKKDEDGKPIPGQYEHFFTNPNTGNEVFAQARIQRYLPVEEVVAIKS